MTAAVDGQSDLHGLQFVRGLLLRAVTDFQTMCSLPHKRAVKSKEAGLESGAFGYVPRREIVSFFFSDDEPYAFSLQGITHLLEVDMDFIRTGLIRYWKTIRIMKKRRERRLGRHGYLSRRNLPPLGPWCFGGTGGLLGSGDESG